MTDVRALSSKWVWESTSEKLSWVFSWGPSQWQAFKVELKIYLQHGPPLPPESLSATCDATVPDSSPESECNLLCDVWYPDNWTGPLYTVGKKEEEESDDDYYNNGGDEYDKYDDDGDGDNDNNADDDEYK